MSAVLKVLGSIRNANGDNPTNNQYYAPLLMAKQDGSYERPGGGLGGGSVGTGDYSYTGIFIHEAGHAFGMPHAGGAYDAGKYPYEGGSLQGSSWGYDQSRELFQPTFVPSTAYYYRDCQKSTQKDDQGRCVKQDPMQGGSGYQAAGDKYTIFSDFNAAVVQRYAETRLEVPAGNSLHYRLWDAEREAYAPYADIPFNNSQRNALYGFNRGLPEVRNVPVHTVVITHSNASTGMTQIYPPLSYTGNLLKTIDPTDATELASITPNSGTYAWYCHASGCDYTLKVTYADNTSEHVVLQGAFRQWRWNADKPGEDFHPSAADPKSGHSFAQWGVNVDGSKKLRKLELLNTPKVYDGMPDAPEVLATWTAD